MKGIILFILTSFFIVSCQKKQYHKNVFILENGELSKLVEVFEDKEDKNKFQLVISFEIKEGTMEETEAFLIEVFNQEVKKICPDGAFYPDGIKQPFMMWSNQTNFRDHVTPQLSDEITCL